MNAHKHPNIANILFVSSSPTTVIAVELLGPPLSTTQQHINRVGLKETCH